MKLATGILRPGIILEVLDNWKIKVSAPGLFSSEDKDLIPPIMPFWELIGSHSNSFSTPVKGDEEKVDVYVNLFYGSINDRNLFGGFLGDKFRYDFSLSKAENASLYCASLNVSEDKKEEIFEKIMAEEK